LGPESARTGVKRAVAERFLRQRFDDTAVGSRPASAYANHPLQLATKRSKLGDLPLDRGELRARDPISFATGVLGLL